MLTLVTGGMGFIGTHTVVQLINEGHEVTIIDNLSNSKKEVLEHIETITGTKTEFVLWDMRDAELLDSIFSDKI